MPTLAALAFSTIVLLLVMVAYEDVRFRAVSWWVFPLLSFSLAFHAICMVGWKEWLPVCCWNLAFLFLQLLLLFAYLAVKQQQLIPSIQGLFGLGDILFMVCYTMCFSTLYFVLFHLASLSIVLLVALIFPKMRTKGIPLAGLQAVCLLFIQIVQAFGKVRLMDDMAIVQLVYTI